MQTHVRGTISIVKFIQNLYLHAIIFAKAIIVKVDIKLDKSTMYLNGSCKKLKKFIYLSQIEHLETNINSFYFKIGSIGQ